MRKAGDAKGTAFLELAETLEKVRVAKGKNEKVATLAGLLSRLKGEEEAEYAARFAAGRATRKGSAEETQVGYSALIGALREVTGVTQAELNRSYLKHGDLSESVTEFIGRRREATLFDGAEEDALSILDVAATFERITEAHGKGSTALKKELVKSLLRRGEGELEAKYIVKILSKEMRIGLVEGLVEEAVAEAFAKDLGREKVKEAYLMLGDIGLLAREAKGGRLGEVRIEPMRPTNFMLAEPMASAEEISSYFEGRELFAEYKYDGVRAQVHKLGGEVKIFSRRLEEMTESFPEVVEAASRIPHDVVVDGEIVAFREGPLSFQLIQRRLRRGDVEESKEGSAPIRYFCFDILYLDGSPIHREPFRARRALLWEVLEGTGLSRADSRTVREAGEIEAFFRESRSLGYEGLVLKDPESPYTPGRRGRYWAKLKEELDTLDVVMVAAEFGHGKRAGKISDYTFAVRDGDGLKVIGKAYSGLTDREIEEMMVRIKKITVGEVGFRMAVRPEIVLEVAFDSIQKSERHDSGYALRFPRIKRVRDDKQASDIDTLDRVKEIYEGQKVKADAA